MQSPGSASPRPVAPGSPVVLRRGHASPQPSPRPGDTGVVLSEHREGELSVAWVGKGLHAVREDDVVAAAEWSPIFAGGYSLGERVVMRYGDDTARPGTQGVVYGGCDSGDTQALLVLWSGGGDAARVLASSLQRADEWSPMCAGGYTLHDCVVQCRAGDPHSKPGHRGVVYGPVDEDQLNVLWDGSAVPQPAYATDLVRPQEFVAEGLNSPAKWMEVGSPARQCQGSPRATGELSPHHAKISETVADMGYKRGCKPKQAEAPPNPPRLHWGGRYPRGAG
eukprot:TRINITY_DN33883_c0_g1_i1.p1 TRINITY_DN33883_c0_g1~~TRINITY_DN33883_c0_g1_i1.p1  ORF type:complete len:280 (+),score=57.37 TRINITY_DN33883_c0_g1_i1:60-899(+)